MEGKEANYLEQMKRVREGIYLAQMKRKVREGKYMILNENENGNEDKKIF